MSLLLLFGVEAGAPPGPISAGSAAGAPFLDDAYLGDAFLGESSFTVTIEATSEVTVDFDLILYVATTEFATAPDDTPANQSFRGVLRQPLAFRRSIVGDGFGAFSTGEGQLIIDNVDANYDTLIELYAVDGREVVIKLVDLNSSYGSAFVVFRGTAVDWIIDEESLTILLRDNGFKLDAPAQPNLYAGTGGATGGADLAQKRKPRAFGYVRNVEPPLVVPNLLIYQVNDGPVEDIPDVYDRGVALTQGVDHASYTLLSLASVPSGQYETCLALGLFKLGSSPDGTVTADVEGDKTDGIFIETTADIVRRIIGAALVDPGDLYTGSFAIVNALQPAPIGYWLGPDDDQTVADVVADLMDAIGGWGGFRRDGTFELALFTAPTGGALALFDRTEIMSIQRLPAPGSLTPPPWRWRVAYARSWTQQDDLAGSVSETHKAFVRDPYRLVEASSATVLAEHPLAKDPPAIEAYFRDEADAQAEADRRLALFRTVRAMYRMMLPRRALTRNVGEVISVTYPRWDLTVGRLMRIVEINEDLSAPREDNIDTIEITAYG